MLFVIIISYTTQCSIKNLRYFLNLLDIHISIRNLIKIINFILHINAKIHSKIRYLKYLKNLYILYVIPLHI